MLAQCWGNVGPASQTVDQHYPSTGPMARFTWACGLCYWTEAWLTGLVEVVSIWQNPFKTRLKGVLLLHLNHNLSTEMTLLVGMLVFINKFPWDFDGKICHL